MATEDKKYFIKHSTLYSIAESIRAKTGKTDNITPFEMAAEIEGIFTGGGECSGTHVIEVDTLPTENIDENTVYLCGWAYYKYGAKLDDVLFYKTPLADATNSAGYITYLYATTKPTENIAVTDDVLKIYYIADENNLFAYGDFDNTGENAWVSVVEFFGVSFGGVISDVSEATGSNLYAFVNDGWTKYIAPAGTLTITESGTYDVSGYDAAMVSTKDAAICGIWEFNSTIDIESLKCGRYYVNFTISADGEKVSFSSMEHPSGSYIKYLNYWRDPATSLVQVYCSDYTYPNNWFNGIKYATVDFGDEPQMITSDFKEWLEANATRVENTGGVGGECSGTHIIEVTELPTENIDENAVYHIGSNTETKVFSDVIMINSGTATSIRRTEGLKSVYCTTKPTENLVNGTYYYVEDEDTVYGCMSGTLVDLKAQYNYLGVISSASQASTDVDGAYVVITTSITKDSCYYTKSDDTVLTDLVVYESGNVMSYIEVYETWLGVTVELYSIPTRTAEGVLESNDTVFYIYYIQDENVAGIYLEGQWQSDMPISGIVSDISEVPPIEGIYLIGTVGGWSKYLKPSGGLDITKNDTYDVADKAIVSVKIPASYVVETVADLPEVVLDGDLAIVLY